MNDLEIKFKKTSDLNDEDIIKLIALKQQYWSYDFECQRLWLSQNIRDDDYHLLVYEENRLIAYLNAVTVNVEIDARQYKMIGIGNVCVDSEMKNTGLGALILSIVNFHIKQLNAPGILLCKKELLGFYQKSSWTIILSNKITVCGRAFSHYLMGYNLKSINDELFEQISIDRNF